MQAFRTGRNNNSSSRDGLVREMDPDVLSREDGKTLAPDDAVCFQVLLYFYFIFLTWGPWLEL